MDAKLGILGEQGHVRSSPEGWKNWNIDLHRSTRADAKRILLIEAHPEGAYLLRCKIPGASSGKHFRPTGRDKAILTYKATNAARFFETLLAFGLGGREVEVVQLVIDFRLLVALMRLVAVTVVKVVNILVWDRTLPVSRASNSFPK